MCLASSRDPLLRRHPEAKRCRSAYGLPKQQAVRAPPCEYTLCSLAGSIGLDQSLADNRRPESSRSKKANTKLACPLEIHSMPSVCLRLLPTFPVCRSDGTHPACALCALLALSVALAAIGFNLNLHCERSVRLPPEEIKGRLDYT